MSKESGQVGSITMAEEQSQQRASQPAATPASPGQNAPLDNPDSSNGGLLFYDNTRTMSLAEEDVNRVLSLPNIDMMYPDAEIMKSKPRMPAQKGQKASRHSHAPGSKGL